MYSQYSASIQYDYPNKRMSITRNIIGQDGSTSHQNIIINYKTVRNMEAPSIERQNVDPKFAVRTHCVQLFSSWNVGLLVYAFTDEDPQPEWKMLDV